MWTKIIGCVIFYCAFVAVLVVYLEIKHRYEMAARRARKPRNRMEG